MNEETAAWVWGAAKVSGWPQHGVMTLLYSYSQCQPVYPQCMVEGLFFTPGSVPSLPLELEWHRRLLWRERANPAPTIRS